MLGIMCAEETEISVINNDMEIEKTLETGLRKFYCGRLYGEEVVLVQANVGKVASAVTCSILIREFHADGIVFIGTGGSMSSECRLGDIVIASHCVQHDMFIPWRELFWVPIIEKSYFESDEKLSARLKKASELFLENDIGNDIPKDVRDRFGLYNKKVVVGTIASGDQFVASDEKRDFIKKNVKNVKCAEMEGAAVSQVCYESKVPFAIARVISDMADDEAVFSYNEFAEKASSRINAGIIRNLLKNT